MSGFPRWHSGNEFTCRCKRLKRCKRCGFNTCVVKIPWEGNSNPLQYSCLKIPCTEEPGRLQFMGLRRVRHNWAHTHYVMLRYVTLRYITYVYHYCVWARELWTWTPWILFFLPTSWVTDVAAVKLWSCRWIQWLDRQRTQYARELHPWMISWSKIPTQANSEGTITCLLSCSNCCLNELFLQVSSFSLLSCHQSDVASTILSMLDNLQIYLSLEESLWSRPQLMFQVHLQWAFWLLWTLANV